MILTRYFLCSVSNSISYSFQFHVINIMKIQIFQLQLLSNEMKRRPLDYDTQMFLEIGEN